MKKYSLFLLIPLLLILPLIGNAESAELHELWDIKFDMSLDECRLYLESEKNLVFDIGDSSITTSAKQSVSFLGHDAIIAVSQNSEGNGIKEVHIGFSFMNGSDPISYTYYKTQAEAIENAYSLLEIVPDVIGKLAAAYGDPTQGALTTKSIREAYDLPYHDGSIDLEVLKQALSERGYLFLVCQFSNICFFYTLDVKEMGGTFHNRPECLLYFRAEERSDAFDGLDGSLGAYPAYEKEVDLGL